MEFTEHVAEAIANLTTTKLRTFLAILGVLVGTASVVAMISGGKLATRQALMQFRNLGTNLMSVQLESTGDSGNGSGVQKKLGLSTVMAIQKRIPLIQAVAPYTNVYFPVTYVGHPLDYGLLGVTESMKPVMKVTLQQGRFISFLDKYQPYAVIGNEVYKKLKEISVVNPVGQQLEIQGNFFTIIGVIKPWVSNSFIYADLNDSILVPLEASTMISKYSDISSIIFRVKEGANLDLLQTDIKNYFSEVSPGNQLYFQSAKEIIASMQKQQEILTVFLGFIGSIALLVGGIGVMNVMLVSVTERRREIGIRLAIGAKRRDIQIMFLIESTLLSLLGGIIGVILGILISFVIAKVKSWGFTLFLMPPLIGFAVSALTGIFFGYYPAYKASKLNPIETLRTE